MATALQTQSVGLVRSEAARGWPPELEHVCGRHGRDVSGQAAAGRGRGRGARAGRTAAPAARVSVHIVLSDLVWDLELSEQTLL